MDGLVLNQDGLLLPPTHCTSRSGNEIASADSCLMTSYQRHRYTRYSKRDVLAPSTEPQRPMSRRSAALVAKRGLLTSIWRPPRKPQRYPAAPVLLETAANADASSVDGRQGVHELCDVVSSKHWQPFQPTEAA